jgi:YebC/PmpR family DNA-binding regulatory protein
MTNEAIDRAVAKGSGTLDGAAMEELTYEGYGPGGVAILIDALTDNRNRTISEVRGAVEKNGGSMGSEGSVAWNFDRKAVFFVTADADKEDALLEVALEAGADELTRDEGGFEITADPTLFGSVSDALGKAGYKPDKSEITPLPRTTVTLEDPEHVARLVRMLSALDDLDDVQSTATNLEWTAAALEAAEQA